MGIRELKDKLSHFVRLARRGGTVLVTDRGEVVAELRPPSMAGDDTLPPGLVELARQGRVRLGDGSTPNYPSFDPVTGVTSQALLDAERGEH